ncbi:t-SNARE [Ramicandelaber brevisporus]|nr:t-SNARE [Ramicandelaber brevisporus]
MISSVAAAAVSHRMFGGQLHQHQQQQQRQSVRDRTNEFRSAVDLLRSTVSAADSSSATTSANGVASSQARHPNSNIDPRRVQFTKLATEIGREIDQTASRLEELAKLAKRKTLFDDRAAEINQLTAAVKRDIGSLNAKIAALQTVTRELNGQRNATKQNSEHSSNVVKMLSTRLASTSSTFMDVLEIRSENIKASASRKENLMASAAGAGVGTVASPVIGLGGHDPLSTSASAPSAASLGVSFVPDEGGNQQSNALIRQSRSPLYQLHRRPGAGMAVSGSDINGMSARSSSYHTSDRFNQSTSTLNSSSHSDHDNEDFVAITLPEHVAHQQLLLQEQQDTYMDQRGQAIQSIESTIAELGTIFQQLANLVSEQGNAVSRIDANVEDIESNVEGAQGELLRYYNNLTSNRWLMIKIFGVVMFFAVLLILLGH